MTVTTHVNRTIAQDPEDAGGFGLIAQEAASAGLPVVAARLEGIPDAVVEGETGVLLTPGDPAAWGEEISRLLGDPRARRRLAENAPQVIRERFSWNKVMAEVLNHFRKEKTPACPSAGVHS